MAITFEQVKQIIIEVETDWLYEVHNDEAGEYIEMMIEDVSCCNSYSQLAEWYEEHGFNISESYENIIKNVLARAVLAKK
jgi:hypothetical protein